MECLQRWCPEVVTQGKRKTPAADRRSGGDRRRVDKGSPNGRERRVGMEPRKPEISEVEITPSEWAALEEDLLRPKPKG
ncbi:MAG: hypothetical protein JSR38_09625 [Proteobacteria bacterium]|nr:hypothetical protein [Pseudomonadota bacterium]